ncbi:MAG TPA: CrcB family protein, partial [Acidimicrobiia bacterium]|nr:CrcB family protein [Acidimicrobiia bacterium]
MLLLGIAVAGAFGAVARFGVDAAVAPRMPSHFPGGTLVINVTGSFVLGLITGAAMYHGLSHDARLVTGTGFCGGYTTFSTFAVET